MGLGDVVFGIFLSGMHIMSKAFFDAHRYAVLKGYSAEMIPDYSRAIDKSEAKAILGTDDSANLEAVKERYSYLYTRNEESGSPYLLAKIQSALECLSTDPE